MEEKNATKISLSTFFLILAIIAIIVMGIFIYKLNNDKTTEIQKSTELQAQVNSLNGMISDLQGKINNISETVNQENKNETTNNKVKIQENNSKVSNNESINNKRISGIFAQNSPEDEGGYWFDAGEYWFNNDGTVENVSSATTSGVYTINGNIINIHWTETDVDEVDISEMQDTEILIKDDNTLLLLTYEKENNNPICWVSGSVFYRQNDN